MNSHSRMIGYILLLVGFTGAHRFYFGKKWTGLLYALSGGLFGIGIVYDLIFMGKLEDSASTRYPRGQYDYSLAWLLLAFAGLFGAHRFYMGKWVTGLLYLFTGGLFGLGYTYDLWTLNEQLASENSPRLP